MRSPVKPYSSPIALTTESLNGAEKPIAGSRSTGLGALLCCSSCTHLSWSERHWSHLRPQQAAIRKLFPVLMLFLWHSCNFSSGEFSQALFSCQKRKTRQTMKLLVAFLPRPFYGTNFQAFSGFLKVSIHSLQVGKKPFISYQQNYSWTWWS